LNASFNTATFPTKVSDTHNAYSGGTYTIPIQDFYTVSAIANVTGTAVADGAVFIAIFKNGVEQVERYTEYSSGSSSSQVNPGVHLTGFFCSAGDLITIRVKTDATTPSYVAAGDRFQFSISN